MPTRVNLRKVIRVRALGACHEWTGAMHKSGYGKRMYLGKTWLAHRAAWDEQVASIPDGVQVLHKCDNRKCVRVEHLFLGDHQANMRDMAAKGRQLYDGENNNRVVLTDQDVAEIRRKYTGTKRNNPNFVSQKDLAHEYGVTQAHISKIIRNQHR